MAFTVTNLKTVYDGPERIRTATLTFDNSYSTSGEAVTPGLFGLQTIDNMSTAGMAAGGFGVRWDRTNQKLWVYGNSTSTTTNPVAAFAEVVSGVDNSALVVDVTVYGS